MASVRTFAIGAAKMAWSISYDDDICIHAHTHTHVLSGILCHY